MKSSYLYAISSLASALWPWFITYIHKIRKMPCPHGWKRQRDSDSRIYNDAGPYYAGVGHYMHIESRKQPKTVMWRSLLRPQICLHIAYTHGPWIYSNRKQSNSAISDILPNQMLVVSAEFLSLPCGLHVLRVLYVARRESE